MTKHFELVDTKYKKTKKQKLFIEPLEQRIILDGAGASTFLDLIIVARSVIFNDWYERGLAYNTCVRMIKENP